MNCPMCNCTPFDRPFMRMNAVGADGIFWCEKCAKQKEPELYRNLKEEETPVEKDLKAYLYPKRK